MTQFQYDAIVKTVVNGAPALADELIQSLADLVNERNAFKEQLENLKPVNETKITESEEN